MDYNDFNPYPPIGAEYEYYGRNSGLPSFVVYPDDIIVLLQDRITDDWINSLFRLNGTTNPTLRRIVPSMFKAIPKETIGAGIEIDPRTNGAVVGEDMQTGLAGVFACGNVLQVHDLVDFVSEEAEMAGRYAAKYVLEDNSSKDYIEIFHPEVYDDFTPRYFKQMTK